MSLRCALPARPSDCFCFIGFPESSSNDFNLNLQVESLSLLSHMAISHKQFDMLTVNDITDRLRHAVARGLLGWR